MQAPSASVIRATRDASGERWFSFGILTRIFRPWIQPRGSEHSHSHPGAS